MRAPEEVSAVEYTVFMKVLSEMDVEALNELISDKAYECNTWTDLASCSPVLVNVVNMLLESATIKADLTIFNKESEEEYDKIEVANNLTKAVMLTQLMKEAKYTSNIAIEEKQQGKYVGYEVNVVTYQRNNPLYSQEIVINVYNCMCSLDPTVDQAVKNALINFGGNSTDKDMKESLLLSNSRDYIITQFLNMTFGESKNWFVAGMGKWSVPGTIYTLTMSATQNSANIDTATEAIKNLKMGNQLTTLDVQATIVIVSQKDDGKVISFASDDVEIYNPRFNREELTIRVGAYNSEHPDEKISVDELITSMVNGDMSILDKYEKWYVFGGEKDCLEDYRESLRTIYDEMKKNNQNILDIGFNDLSSSQLQEIILKYEDPTHEVDTKLWEIN